MTYVLVVMAFMNTYGRNDWAVPTVVQPFSSIETCEAVGKAMQEMERRTQYRCVKIIP